MSLRLPSKRRPAVTNQVEILDASANLQRLPQVSQPTMKGFAPYVKHLEGLAEAIARKGARDTTWHKLLGGALDGQPAARLRELVPLHVRKDAGAFFTGTALAKLALGGQAPAFSETSVIFDPACGVGDLLVACARNLPTKPDLLSTLSRWGNQLHGRDLHVEFIRAAKARLLLLGLSMGLSLGKRTLPPLDELLPNISVGDGLKDLSVAKAVSDILINPPFQKVQLPSDCPWGSGRMSLAAIFMDRCLSTATPGTRITAILPDVLRSGVTYSRWRSWVEARARVESIKVHGVFDSWADVDVFILKLVVGGSAAQGLSWNANRQFHGSTIRDYFELHVGTVVPHRHEERGSWHPYVTTRRLKPWIITNADNQPKRRYQGRTFKPPFVAVRRTSAPGDVDRAVGTLVRGRQPVAVENHLLVLLPKDGSFRQCRQLMAVLRDSRTKDWLDMRIRCRHLTVEAVSEMPWWDHANSRS